MKGILKKAMAAALVAVMVLSMSGCTEEEQPQTNQPQQEQQQGYGNDQLHQILQKGAAFHQRDNQQRNPAPQLAAQIGGQNGNA